MDFKKFATNLDKLARDLSKKDLSKHAFILCQMRDEVISQVKKAGVSDHALRLDRLARKAHKAGLLEVAGELSEIRDAVYATALDGPDSFRPVNTSEEGYPNHSSSDMAVDDGDKKRNPAVENPEQGPKGQAKNKPSY